MFLDVFSDIEYNTLLYILFEKNQLFYIKIIYKKDIFSFTKYIKKEKFRKQDDVEIY